MFLYNLHLKTILTRLITLLIVLFIAYRISFHMQVMTLTAHAIVLKNFIILHYFSGKFNCLTAD